MKLNQLKDFCEKNKTLIILIAISLIMLVLFLYLLLFTGKKEQISDKSLEKQELQTSSNEYAMQNPFVVKKEQNTSIPMPPPLLHNEQNTSALEENETEIPNPSQDFSKQSTPKEVVKDMKKPNDMVQFLKGIQDKIQLKKERFQYDLKEYSVGDKFLNFYPIEEIGENYIRFKDENYSYNLRWIGEDNE